MSKRLPAEMQGDILNEPTLSTCQRIGHTPWRDRTGTVICKECGERRMWGEYRKSHVPVAYKDHSDAWIQCSCGWGSFGSDGEEWSEHFERTYIKAYES
jgi:hypothetical protein